MAEESEGKPLLERYRALDAQARHAWADLNRSPRVAATAVYDLRLALRIIRILKHFICKDPDFIAVEGALDDCYRAIALVRDGQVGLGLVRLLEKGGLCPPPFPSVALKARLWQDTRQLSATLDQLGLVDVLQGLDRAFSSLQRRRSEEQMQHKARKVAQRLDVMLLRGVRGAWLRPDEADWHGLRLAIKRYRFWVLTLADWLPAACSERVVVLKPLQVALGDYHDWVVLEARLPELKGAPVARWQSDAGRFKQVSLDLARAQLEPLLLRKIEKIDYPGRGG